MLIEDTLSKEQLFLQKNHEKAIMISTTAKHNEGFMLLPRRNIKNMNISGFIINDSQIAKEVITFFDGKVDYIYIDVERKQHINLFNIANNYIRKSKLVTVKPNDMTLESCDLLIRSYFTDNLYNKKVIVIGTGNLSSKIAVRLAERQAEVFIMGRIQEKESDSARALNLFLPKYSTPIQPFQKFSNKYKADLIVSFISGKLENEGRLHPIISENSFIIDGGINNFSKAFVRNGLSQGVIITRLDTRIALPYQIISQMDYTKNFFKEVFGSKDVHGVEIVSGGVIGNEGAVIVDNIKQPSQIIGIADGSGGVKADGKLSETERDQIQKIQSLIYTSNKTNI